MGRRQDGFRGAPQRARGQHCPHLGMAQAACGHGQPGLVGLAGDHVRLAQLSGRRHPHVIVPARQCPGDKRLIDPGLFVSQLQRVVAVDAEHRCGGQLAGGGRRKRRSFARRVDPYRLVKAQFAFGADGPHAPGNEHLGAGRGAVMLDMGVEPPLAHQR